MAVEDKDQDKDKAEQLLDNLNDQFLQGLVADAKDSSGFTRVAANIAQDRYSAGSSAARITIYIMLVHGYQMAVDFMNDLDHNEQ